ncbi:MAG: dinitrogenase iron-molybdenum cofactor [Firmicutes bacterium]|nr:dinitrogenase iron-molybdenum cofactor [Bacillota bacterium]
MRIAISTEGEYVSQHFGRCQHFTLVDIENGETKKREVIPNPGHSPGYIPQFLHQRDVNCIVCGGMGTRAAGYFEEYGIKIITGIEGKIDEVVAKLEKGILKGGNSLCTPGAGKGYGVEKTECDHPHDN